MKDGTGAIVVRDQAAPRRGCLLLGAGLALLPMLAGACENAVAPEAETIVPAAEGTLVTGAVHTCGIAESGRVYCWGDNRFGALGASVAELCPGIGPCSPAPVAVSSNLRFEALAAGGSHTCGIVEGGRAYCWGNGSVGQLGTGEPSSRATPAPVAGDQRFARLSAGGSHTCGLTLEGAVWCWGSNALGAMGVPVAGIADRRPHPVRVLPHLRFAAIGTGENHTCAITDGGEVLCWGSNRAGQLGGGDTRPEADGQTVTVGAGVRFQHVSGGSSHTCALDVDQVAWCWGTNTGHALGPGVPEGQMAPPTPVFGRPRFVGLNASGATTCGLTSAGEAVCWPDRTGDSLAGPGPVRFAGPFIRVTPGSLHTCGLAPDGRALCWGNNLWGQLGTDAAASTTTPTPVAGGIRFRR